MLNAIKKHGFTLAAFALASTGLVAVTHSLTESRIEQQQNAQLKNLLNQVFPSKLHDNALFKNCYVFSAPFVKSGEQLHSYRATFNGEYSGVVLETLASDGYNGRIKAIVGVNSQGDVTGTRVVEHSETPGLGDKVDYRITHWVDSFIGKHWSSENDSTWQVHKDGGSFDQFTGATITPRAVVKSVRNILVYLEKHKDEITTSPANCGDIQ
jgi:electron transport complex protein RnfG